MVGSVVLLAAVLLSVVSCVSQSAYDQLAAKYQHAQAVRVEQDQEEHLVRSEVQALHRAYGDMSGRTTGMQGQMEQTVQDVAGLKTRVNAATQELSNQKFQVSRIEGKVDDVGRMMQAALQEQQKTSAAVEALTATLVKTTKMPAKGKAGKTVQTEGSGETKSAVDLALEQKAKQDAQAGLVPSVSTKSASGSAVTSQSSPAAMRDGEARAAKTTPAGATDLGTKERKGSVVPPSQLIAPNSTFRQEDVKAPSAQPMSVESAKKDGKSGEKGKTTP